MQAVSKEVAVDAVESWMDHKRVKNSKRESSQDAIETLTNGFEDGILVLDDESFEVTMELNFPIGMEGNVKHLVFKPRLQMKTIHKHLKGKKATEADARILAYVCALTGQPSTVIQEMDTEDYSICQSFATFFF